MTSQEFIFNWNWKDFCGDGDNFTLWNKKYNDLDFCFQYLCLDTPVLALIAIVSAYYHGLSHLETQRCSKDLWILKIRYCTTLALAALPVIKSYIEEYLFPGVLNPVDYLLASVQCFSWFVHFGFVLSMSHRHTKTLRGPVMISVLWAIYYILCFIKVHSTYLIMHHVDNPKLKLYHIAYIFSIVQVVFQSCYLFTLLPNGETCPPITFGALSSTQGGEHTPLLGIHGTYSRFREDLDPNYLGVALEGWGKLSILLFSWVNPLMEKGVEGKLQSSEELFDLPDSLTTSHLALKLRKSLNKSVYQQLTPSVSLLKALHVCFWKEFYGIGIFKFVSDLSGFAGPLLLHELVTFIDNKDEPIINGYFYAFGLFISTLIGAFCSSHFNFRMSFVGLRIRGALIATVYRKTLSLNAVTLSQFSTGEVLNFMSTDMDRIVNSCPSFHAFWSIPFQIIVTLYLLYQQVGVAFLAGVGFSIVLIPINKCIATQIGKLSTKMMSYKDERILIISELLKGIRIIKFFVWEEFFMRKVGAVRSKEMKYLAWRKYLDALCVYFWATTPVLITFLTFLTYVYLGNKLTAPVVFTSIALLNMLITPLNAFPWVLNGLTEALVSIRRVEKLLMLPDCDTDSYYNQNHMNDKPGTLIIQNGNFYWGEPNFCLSNINLNIKEGQLVGVIGKVGSGKSSLLSAFLAELEKTSGSVFCADHEQGIAYVAQTPWLQQGTLQENILFGEPYIPQRYWSVIESCALTTDLESLPGRDNTGIGDGGSTLSGGQKARVALARAVYQNCSVYLLDDVLSAVDPYVAKHIYTHCICGLLKLKTRILCTHQTKYLINADWIVMLDEGKIVKQGPPSEVLPNYVELLTDAELDKSEVSDKLPAISVIKKSESLDTILLDEKKDTGSIEFKIYLKYFSAIGYILMPLILISIVLMQGSRNLVDLWLSYWVSNLSNNSTNASVVEVPVVEFPENDSTMFYITVYCALAGANSIFTLFRAFLFAFGGLAAAKKMHDKLLTTVVLAKTYFFDTTPVGRIINRFSSDVYTIDDSLPFILNILLAQFFNVVGTVFITIYGLPWVWLVLAPLIPIYHWLQNHYRLTSRELKRLTSLSLSPLYTHFNDTLQGLATIRAFRVSSRFKHDNGCYLECNQKAQLSSFAASQWLSLRLQLIGVAMVTSVGFLAIVQHHLDFADAGFIGLAISYALTLTGSLGGVVNAFTETERELISVERLAQYYPQADGGLEVEKQLSLVSVPYGWPAQGVIIFNNVFFRYRDHLPYSLVDVSFSTRPCERIGVIGRTGAGKSSLIAALFRLNELSEGLITIDTVNTRMMSLQELRSRMGVIPQDPFIFSGSVRLNLDPKGKHTDSELWDALGKASLTSTVTSLGGLNATLKKDSLSKGQMQLLCLARALLRNAKILCIDEATANVDEDTDRIIQEMIRNNFKQSTVITIAHRVKTVLDSHRVLVMSNSQVLEFDTPANLLKDRSSYFYQVVNENYF